MFKYMIGYIKAKLKILSFFAIVAFLTTGLSIVLPYYNGRFIDSISYKPNKATVVNYVIKCFEKSIRKLSGGEQQKIRLLCSLLLNCSVLILDEPTSQIDKQSSMIIKDYLESEKKNRIIIIVTHDIKLANDFQDAKRLNLKLLRGEETC